MPSESNQGTAAEVGELIPVRRAKGSGAQKLDNALSRGLAAAWQRSSRWRNDGLSSPITALTWDFLLVADPSGERVVGAFRMSEETTVRRRTSMDAGLG